MHTVTCKQCGKDFDTNHSKKIYCSYECQREALKVMNRRRVSEFQKKYRNTCRWCKVEFRGGRGQRYCSPDCKAAASEKRENDKRGGIGKGLSEVARKARASGMSYGQYVASMEGGRT